MRSYRRNSPEAAARIVAWTMLADGNDADADAAACGELPAMLGMSPERWNGVVRDLCEDLLATGASDWHLAVRPDPTTFVALLGELDDPTLRQRVLSLCRAIAEADGRLSEGERVAVETARQAWQADADVRVAG